ncbi:MAG: hypothetical protein ACK6D3_13105 [Planctomycetaceae bacterium]|jgi:hypothetical protein
MIRLTTLLDDHELFHSEFQIRNLIVARNGGTFYGAYKQAIRELWNRLSGIGSELALLGVMKKQTSKNGNNKNDCTSAHQLAILFESIPTLKDTIREIAILYNLASWLKTRLGDLNHQSKQLLESELWIYRVKCAVAVDFLSIGRLSQPTIELLHALPIELRQSILDILMCPESQEFLIQWYLTDYLNLPTIDTGDLQAISGKLIDEICDSPNWFGLTRKRISAIAQTSQR